jgi:hypothetical protein
VEEEEEESLIAWIEVSFGLLVGAGESGESSDEAPFRG